jgi:hypothetical protein
MKIRGKRFIPLIVAYLLQVIALGALGQGSPPDSVPGLRLKPPQWTSAAPAWVLQDPPAPASIFPAGLKASGIPLRLRLGSVDYCDFLEGKTLHSPQP